MKFLADENLDGRLVRAIRLRFPGADLVRAIDVGLSGVDDPGVLAWAAREGRLVMTHDVATMVGFAYDRVDGGLPMPGLIELPPGVPIASALLDFELLLAASRPDEWDGQVLYFPL